MHFLTTPPVFGGPAALALAAPATGPGTIIVAVIAIVFVALVVVGSRPSVMAKYGGGDAADGAPEGQDRPAERGRR